MPSPLSRRLDKAEAVVGVGPHTRANARHVVASLRDYHTVSRLFRSVYASLPLP